MEHPERQEPDAAPEKHARPRWLYWIIALAAAAAIAVLIVHLASGGIGGHGL